jgi:Putative zinc-finger
MSNAQPLACARVRALLEAYADGDLGLDDPKLAAEIKEHLGGCADCRRQHEQAISLPFRLRALSSPQPPATLVARVLESIAPARQVYRRAWTLLVPETVLAAFILWYMSGLEGLRSIASGILGDLQGLAGWGSGAGSLPSIPRVDVVLLIALIALAAIAGYHLSILIRLTPTGLSTQRTARE